MYEAPHSSTVLMQFHLKGCNKQRLAFFGEAAKEGIERADLAGSAVYSTVARGEERLLRVCVFLRNSFL
jgi:hypothetical protein